MRQWVRLGVVWALGLSSVTVAGAARAQDAEEGTSTEPDAAAAPSAGHQAMQLSLQGSVFDYLKLNSKPDKDPAQSTQPEDEESSSTTYGLLGSGFGLGIGYVWDDVLLGARAQFTSTTQSPSGGGDTQTRSIAFLPRVEYLFETGSNRLYLAGLLSVEHASASATVTVTGGAFPASATFKTENSSTRFGVGAAFGAHAFLTRSLSIDPEISVLPSWGTATLKTGAGDDSTSRDSSVSALRVMFSIGLSGWLDTAGEPTPPAREERAMVAPVAAAPIVSTEPDVKPLSADIHLPNHRRLYLQVLKDPAQPAVLVRLTEPRNGAALRKCDDVSVTSSAESIKLSLRTHGDYYSTGRLPIRGVQVLGGVVDSSISVCGDSWQLGQESREQVQAFLRARRELINDADDADVPEAPPVEVTPSPAVDTPSEPVAPSATPPASK